MFLVITICDLISTFDAFDTIIIYKSPLSTGLPLELSTEAILVDELLVVGPQLVNSNSQVIVCVLGVEVELVKETNPIESLFVFFLHQMLVGTLIMPRIGRVVANHVETFARNRRIIGNQHAIHVFVVTPCKHELVQTTVWFVATVFGIVLRVVHVWIERVEFRQDDAVGSLYDNRSRELDSDQAVWSQRAQIKELTATDNKRIASKSPLLSSRRVAILSVFTSSP